MRKLATEGMKCTMGIICIMAVVFLMPTWVYAAPDNACWTKVSDGWVLQDDEGNDLAAKVRGNTLYIQGTGAVPSYTRESLGNRPWHNQTIYAIEIEQGITSIGAEAFSNFPHLASVTMFAGTFIEDASAFGGAQKNACFYIYGMNIKSRDIGAIPYTSYDSIVAFMERYNHMYHYRVANHYMIQLAQGKTNGALQNIAPLDTSTTEYNANYPYVDLNTSIQFAGMVDSDKKITVSSRQQGLAALEVFSMVIGDCAYIGGYTITLTQNGKAVKQIEDPVTLVMTIPEYYRLPGRKFSLIQLGAGVVTILGDEDVDDSTITFTTNYPSTGYALIYDN